MIKPSLQGFVFTLTSPSLFLDPLPFSLSTNLLNISSLTRGFMRFARFVVTKGTSSLNVQRNLIRVLSYSLLSWKQVTLILLSPRTLIGFLLNPKEEESLSPLLGKILDFGGPSLPGVLIHALPPLLPLLVMNKIFPVSLAPQPLPNILPREFQINAEDNVQLHPPLPSHPPPETEATPPLDEDDLDDEFLASLGVVHHNPNLLLDADMTEVGSLAANLVVAPGDSTAPDGLKCRKRDDFEAQSPSSTSTI